MKDNPKKNKMLYTLECDFEYLVTLFVCDSFLALLLSNLGISDDKIGVISSLISLSFIFQLFSIILIPKIKNSKLFSCIIHGLGQLLFSTLFLLPFLDINENIKRVLVVLIILLAYFMNYIANSIIYRWGNSFVDPNKRAVFSAKKEIISLISGALIQLISGKIIDNYIDTNNLDGGFLFIAISIAIFSILDLLTLIFMNKERINEEKIENNSSNEEESFFRTIFILFKNKKFIKLVICASLYTMAIYTTTGFLGTYKINELNMSMTLVQVLAILGVLSRALFSIPLGKYADKHSFVKGFTLGLIIYVVSFIFLMFTAPTTWYFMIFYVIIYNIGCGATSGNLYNAVYSYVDNKHFSQAFALSNSIRGISGFLISIIAGKILECIQSNSNIVLGINIYGQQILAFISLIILIINIIFNKFFLEKEHVVKR